MARVGGRNAWFAWIVGLICAGIVGALAYVAWPMLSPSLAWVDDTVNGTTASATPAPSGTDAEASALPTSCRDLYSAEQWPTLSSAPGAELTPSTDPPVTEATKLVEALGLQVTMTCTWTSDAGTISTTLATVPTDAGSILAAALPDEGYTCDQARGMTECTRADGEVLETIMTSGGLWLSSTEDGWQPSQYMERVATRIWD